MAFIDTDYSLNHPPLTQPPVEQRQLLAWEGNHAFFVDFASKEIPTLGNITAKVGNGVCFNYEYPWNWLMHYSGQSYIEINPVLTQEEAGRKWKLGMSHLSSLPGNSPISIEVNGVMIEHCFLPLVNAWRQDAFLIDLQEGANSIVIRLLENARTNYWIEKLYLDPAS